MPIDRRRLLASSLVVLAGSVVTAGYTHAFARARSKGGRVFVSDLASAPNRLQSAIATGAREVIVDQDVEVATPIELRSDLVLRFEGGRIVVTPDAVITSAVLHAARCHDITIVDPLIDASATLGVTAIGLLEATRARLTGGHLIRSNVRIESFDNRIDRATTVEGLAIDMQGLETSAIYLSGVRNVEVSEVTCSGGLEGIAIYNDARDLRFLRCTAYANERDGFLLNAGKDIAFIECRAYSNRQSGFTTQRQLSGEDSLAAVWTRCSSWDNLYDGFDIRGANEVSWNVDTGFELSSCTAHSNGHCGFYVVQAEGTMLEDCAASDNLAQNLFINGSNRVTASNFKSVSGAQSVPSGPAKAGILIHNSDAVTISTASSGNRQGGEQEFGVSVTGLSAATRVIGGEFANNLSAPIFPDTVERH